MPVLTLQADPKFGPLIAVEIGVSKPRAEMLAKANLPTPTPVAARALIDTGASGVCVDSTIIQALSITPTGRVPIHTPSTAGVPVICNHDDVSFAFLHPRSTYRLPVVGVMEATLASQGIHVLIGRTVLENCLFAYDGTTGMFSIAF